VRRTTAAQYRRRHRRSAGLVAAALVSSVALPLTFTSIDQLPAGAAGSLADTPGPSPSVTCATLVCPPAQYSFPVGSFDVVTTPNTPLTVDVLAHDCDSTLPNQTYYMGYILDQPPPSEGSVAIGSNNDYVFTPASGYTGDATFYYAWYLESGSEIDPNTGQVIGIDGWSQTGSVTVNVTSVQPQGTALTVDAVGGGSLDEQCQCGTAPASAVTADPVNTATGDFYETRTDLVLPGAGPPLEFTRTYDAQEAQAQATSSATPPPLGYGWANNFDMSVSYDSSTQTATVTDENGAQTLYAPYVSGTSPAWCTGSTNFCAEAPRVETTLNQNGDGTWTLERFTGGQTTFTFASTGSLTSVTDATGNSISASSYSPTSGQTPCPAGDACQAWTSSASGRELVVATDSGGQLVEVFDANSSLAASFLYSGTGCSTWTAGPSDLCQVTEPGGETESFTYDAANSQADLDYDVLTDVPPGASSATTNVYNSAGQITQQTAPNGDVTTFAFSGNNSTLAGGTTTVTDYPDGTGSGEPQDVTVYTYSSNVLIGTTTGAGTSSASSEVVERDPVSLQPTAVQDGNGNATTDTYQTYNGSGGTGVSSANVLTSTDAMGNTTAYAYTALNQAWCTVDPADYANGVTCPATEPTAPPSPGSTDPYLGASINFYNAADELIATTDALGNTTTFAFTAGVSGVPDGLMYCSVDPASYQDGVTCPTYGASHVTGTTTHTFDSAGDTLTTTDADGNTTTYTYDAPNAPGAVSTETAPDGTVTSFTYNAAGQVLKQVVAFRSYSATTQYAYDQFGRQYCAVTPSAYAQGASCPASAPTTPPTPGDDPYLGATITTYDASGQVVQVTNPLGGITLTAYDQSGHVFCTVAPAEVVAGVACPASAPTTPPTPGDDPYLGATMTTYNASGQVVQVTNPLGGITLTTYDGAGNVASTTTQSDNTASAPDVTTSYAYNLDNQQTASTVDSGSTLAATTLTYYDPNGNAYCTVSANAYANNVFSCPEWQPQWIAAPPVPSTLYSSTPSSSTADDVTTDFYNAGGDLLESINPDQAVSVQAYDSDGRVYCTSDPVNVAAWVAANPSGVYPFSCPSSPPTSPPAQGSNPGYATTIYDPAGLTLSTTDPLGDTTSYTYDAGGHVLTTTDPRGEVTTNCYYAEVSSGECAASAPASGGSADDLYSTTTPATSADPSGETTTHTYFPGGATDTIANPAGTANKAYDAQGDLLSTAYSDVASGYATPPTVSDAFNVDGTVHTMTDAADTTTYGYDALGDVTSQSLVAATGSGLANTSTAYSYFSTGVLATVTYPVYAGSSDPVVSYAYDATGAMISSTDWLGNEITYAHDFNGNETAQNNAVSTANPSGTSSTVFSYDPANENTGAVSTLNQTCGSSETLTQSYSGSSGSRNADGQLTQASYAYTGSCSGQSSLQFDFSYDQAGRVVYEGTSPQGSSANNFAYDPSGDPTTFSSHDSSGSFNTYTQSFDAAGEITAQTPVSGSGGGSSTYTFDSLGDQTKAQSTATVTYGFNAAGQMVSTTSGSGTTTYLYNGNGLESATTSSGGSSSPEWGTHADVNSTRAISAVACPSSTFCVAVGASGYATTYNGTSWSTPVDVDGSRAIDAVSCASSSFCVAVGASGYEATYSAGVWSAATRVDSSRALKAVACPSSTFCVAVGASGYATTYNGTSWSTPVDIDGSRAIDAVSCASSSFCVAVGASGYEATYSAGTWSSAQDINGSRTIDSVSCPSSTFCVAVGASGYEATYSSGTWSSAVRVDSSRTMDSVSCASSSFCVAIGTSGYAVTSDGTSWSTPVDVDGSNALTALACQSSTFCMATDSVGNVIENTGSTWTAPSDVDGSRSIASLSCASTTFCVLGDGSGYEATFATPPPTNTVSQLTWNSTNSLAQILSDGTYDYVYGPGTSPVEQIALSTSVPTFMTYEPSSSTWLSTNAAGDETSFYGYDAFGSLAFGAPTSAFGYAGQYVDAATGFSNLRARWFDSGVGEFTVVDPNLSSTGTAYTYAKDDPVNFGDPSGAACSSSQQSAGGAEVTSLNPSFIFGEGTGTTGQQKPQYDNFHWAALVLAYGKWPEGENNRTTVLDWMASEQSDLSMWWTGGNINPAHINPLNNGNGSGGGSGQGTYGNLVIAARHVSIELSTPGDNFGPVVADFSKDAPPIVTSAAIWHSGWAAGHYRYGSAWHTGPVASVNAPESLW
jgi:RHS repeat-associated protein